MEATTPVNPLLLDASAFKDLFNLQLATMHCALTHLATNLPQLSALASFNSLQHAVDETLADTNSQLARVEKIAGVFGTNVADDKCLGVKAIIKEALLAVSETREKSLSGDIALIFYLHAIKHLEVAAYRTLLMAATKLGYSHAQMLLTENMDEAKDDSKLFRLISNEYLLN